MERDDLESIRIVGRALWADEERCDEVTREALTTIAILQPGLTEERQLEKVSAVLLARAIQDGVSAGARGIHLPFFRLTPEERLILNALHSGRWSYVSLSRVLGESVDTIQQRAWAARRHLASQPELRGARGPVRSPISLPLSPRCPEDRPDAPWMQRFLDEECGRTEMIFLQNHLMACPRCRDLLMEAKSIYYAIESAIPAESQQGEEWTRSWQEVLARSLKLRDPSRQGFWDAFQVFLARGEVRVALGAFLIAWLWNHFKG